MASQTDILNMALLKMGEKTVTSIGQDTPTATKLRAAYDVVLDEALAAGPEKGWKFTKERETISVDATSPDSEYDYRFALPNGILRIINVHADGTDYTDWVREGQYILTNQVDDEIDLIYVKRVTNTGLFPPHFTRVLYMMLAYQLAFNIIQSKTHANQIFEELYFRVLPKAIALDEQDGYVQEGSSSWVDAGRTTSILE
ncbi:MAG: hypothetical protein GY832_11600 [Chloroflexi bacterium]|nr:hypothetical protein [Chloroflexota bacterium]